MGLRIYRVRWNGNYLVEAVFAQGTPDSRLQDARALLGESGSPVHPDDLDDYKRATEEGIGGVPGWVRRLFFWLYNGFLAGCLHALPLGQRANPLLSLGV